MNKKIVLPGAAAAIAILLAVGFAWRDSGRDNANTLTLYGNVDIRRVELAFNASDRIAAIAVQEGQRVAPGQLLARLDGERLGLALRQAEAQAAAQAQLVQRAEHGSRPEEIRQARAQRDAAHAAMENAELVYRRQQRLAERNFVSPQQVDSARLAYDAAREQWQAAVETARLAELGPRREDIAAARATLLADEALAAQLRHDLAQVELHAPSAGVIEKRILEVGDMASPQKPVLTLALDDPLWVRVWLPETQLGRIPVGAAAVVGSDSHAGKTYRGWIGYVSPTAEFTPKSVETTEVRAGLVYQARVFVCGGRDELRLGMPATVSIDLDQTPPPAGADPCAAAPAR